MKKLHMSVAVVGIALLSSAAHAVTVGPGGFDNGYATSVTFDDTATTRGTSNDRDNGLNSLGATDGDFFEVGLGETVEFSFGTLFTSPGTVVEVTFGNPANHPESANIFVGLASDANSFVAINENPILNSGAQNGFSFTFAGGPFDTLRIVDTTTTSASTGGFDIDSIQVAAIPLPAGMLLLGSALAGLGALRRRKTAS